MEQIYSHFGVSITKYGNKFFLEYDSGEIVSEIKKIEISEQDAKELQELKDGKSIFEYMINNLNDRI